MCGLSGFIGVPKAQAWGLVYGLGAGIDTRGGHASGYVSVKDTKVRLNKKLGEWSEASRKFIRHAAKSDILMMHARWATCGIQDSIDHAHPFEIVRNDATVLYGCHNGMIWDGAEESAKKHGREYTVDSREVFELLADEEYDVIRDLDGYGVLTWYEPGSDHIKMVRLSENSEISVCSLKRGGLVWASTDEILYDALDLACLKKKVHFNLPNIGMVYKFKADNVWESNFTDLKFKEYTRTRWGTHNDDKEPESWETKLMAKWQAEEDAKEKKAWEDASLLGSWERDLEQAEREEVLEQERYAKWFGEQDHDGEYPSIAGTYR